MLRNDAAMRAPVDVGRSHDLKAGLEKAILHHFNPNDALFNMREQLAPILFDGGLISRERGF